MGNRGTRFEVRGQALAYVYFEDEPGRPISSSTANAKGAVGRLDGSRAFVLRACNEPESAARSLNRNTTGPLVRIVHKLVEPNA
jgi:hypothetical protein